MESEYKKFIRDISDEYLFKSDIEDVSQIDIKQIQAIIERSTIMNYVDGYWIDSITEIE